MNKAKKEVRVIALVPQDKIEHKIFLMGSRFVRIKKDGSRYRPTNPIFYTFDEVYDKGIRIINV